METSQVKHDPFDFEHVCAISFIWFRMQFFGSLVPLGECHDKVMQNSQNKRDSFSLNELDDTGKNSWPYVICEMLTRVLSGPCFVLWKIILIQNSCQILEQLGVSHYGLLEH